MVNWLMLEKLHEFVRCNGRGIVSVDSAGGPYWAISF